MTGVITGDIINSTSISAGHKTALLAAIAETSNELEVFSPLQSEVFRGDSFQLMVERPEMAMQVAVMFRAGLKSRTPKDAKQLWDARLAVGIGDVDYLSDRVTVSDGEAFRLSGREFDELGRRTLSVMTRWEDVNKELYVLTLFVDDIISNWTVSQSLAVYMSIVDGMTQKDIADRLGQSAQNISKLSTAAREKHIRTYLNRCNLLITNKLS
jgi:hypothetical protein